VHSKLRDVTKSGAVLPEAFPPQPLTRATVALFAERASQTTSSAPRSPAPSPSLLRRPAHSDFGQADRRVGPSACDAATRRIAPPAAAESTDRQVFGDADEQLLALVAMHAGMVIQVRAPLLASDCDHASTLHPPLASPAHSLHRRPPCSPPQGGVGHSARRGRAVPPSENHFPARRVPTAAPWLLFYVRGAEPARPSHLCNVRSSRSARRGGRASSITRTSSRARRASSPPTSVPHATRNVQHATH
jgi:hypothetical protein